VLGGLKIRSLAIKNTPSFYETFVDYVGSIEKHSSKIESI